jgi:hypothetical protein
LHITWYNPIYRFIKRLSPKLRKTRAANLARLVSGIIHERSATLFAIARACPGKAIHRDKVKRLWRFVDNEAVCPLSFSAKLIPFVCSGWDQAAYIPIVIDWTDIAPFKSLWAAIPFRRRALPLASLSIHPRDIEHCQNRIEEGFLRRLLYAIPASAPVLFLADRGFGRASLFQFLQSVPSLVRRRVYFAIRVNQNALIEWQGRRRRLRDLALRRDVVYWYSNVKYRQDGVVTVNLAVLWRSGYAEPWYIVTNLYSSRLAIGWYEKRTGIEEMFRDLKTHLGMEHTRIHDADRLDRLLIGMILAYLVLAWVGTEVVPNDYARQLLSWGEASFLWLALRYYDFDRRLGHSQPMLRHPPP